MFVFDQNDTTCISLDSELHDGLFAFFITIVSVSYGLSTFVLFLVVIEGKLLRSSIMENEQKKSEMYCARRRSRRQSSKDTNVEDMYDKIDSQYLQDNQPSSTEIEENISVQETIEQELSWNHKNQLSLSQDLTTPASAEMILRQLFVPHSAQSNGAEVFYENLPIPMTSEEQPDSSSKSIIRRFTFDSAFTTNGQHQEKRKSSLSSIKKQSTKRRKALVFSNRLDFSDDTYSTIV